MKELVVLNKSSITFDDIIDLLNKKAVILHEESNNLKNYVIDISPLKPNDRLRLLLDYSTKINYQQHKPIVESFHRTLFLSTHIESGISNRNKQSTLNNEINKFSKGNHYNEYLRVNLDLDLDVVKTQELLIDNSSENFYFSKTLLQSIKESFKFYDDYNTFFTKIFYKGKETIAFKIESFDKKHISYYDISYNPPNGSGLTVKFV